LTANEDSNDVSIVDLESGAVTNIPVGGAPRKIAVQSSQAERSSSSRQISISGFAFSPPILEVSPGETVTWINDDGAPHRIALKDGTASDILMPAKSYSSKFEQVGNYDYFCSIHPYMTGKIVVTERQAVTGLPRK
jgi:YVTN family beta-propeller protein